MPFWLNLQGVIMTFIVLFIALASPTVWATTLYDASNYRPLIADKKAYLPGDLLTVLVMETATAQSSADLDSHKGIKLDLEGAYNKIPQEAHLGLNGKGRLGAQTKRDGKIKAALTVQIKAIQPGGTYLIEGNQRIRINGEQQTIVLSGVIRPEDISTQNTILSTRVARARISYSGKGSVSNAERHHYLYRLLSFIGLV
jgi:flagellar L-ring protein FlgH